MNQAEFAEKLGMKQTGVSAFEKLGGTVTGSTIKVLCLVFNLNENWLRNGVEPMILEPEIFSLDEFAKKRGATDLELEIMKIYFELEPNIRYQVVEHFRKHLLKSQSTNKSISVPIELESSALSLDQEADQFAAIARAQFISEKKRELGTLSVKKSGVG